MKEINNNATQLHSVFNRTHCFKYIIESAENLPRVEVVLFPFPEYKKFVLRSIRPDEDLVDNCIKRVLAVYEANKVGPQK